jgi:hypothetical protein
MGTEIRQMETSVNLETGSQYQPSVCSAAIAKSNGSTRLGDIMIAMSFGHRHRMRILLFKSTKEAKFFRYNDHRKEDPRYFPAFSRL